MSAIVIPQQEGESWPYVARLQWQDGTPFTQAVTGTYGIVDVTLRVYLIVGESSTPAVAIYAPPNLAVTAVLFASLQLDGYWQADDKGYNFRHTIALGSFEQRGGRRYQIEYTFNPHASNTFGARVAQFLTPCEGAYSS